MGATTLKVPQLIRIFQETLAQLFNNYKLPPEIRETSLNLMHIAD